jgi:hypothetical protein
VFTTVLLLFSGDELKQTVSIVVDLASVLDPDGVDIYFLNREPMLHVRNSSELENIFAMDPEGKSYIKFFVNDYGLNYIV